MMKKIIKTLSYSLILFSIYFLTASLSWSLSPCPPYSIWDNCFGTWDMGFHRWACRWHLCWWMEKRQTQWIGNLYLCKRWYIRWWMEIRPISWTGNFYLCRWKHRWRYLGEQLSNTLSGDSLYANTFRVLNKKI